MANIVVEFTYEDGVLRPVAVSGLPEGSELRLTIEMVSDDGSSETLPQIVTVAAGERLASESDEKEAVAASAIGLAVADAVTQSPAGSDGEAEATEVAVDKLPVDSSAEAATRVQGRVRWLVWLPWLLFGGALLVYAITRFVSIDKFPIYFFTDEAIHPVLGTEMIARGFRDAQGRLFPPYFQNGSYWNLSLSVYLQGIVAWLLGKSILVTRGLSALISLSGVVAVALTLKLVFRIRYWWASVFVLATIPAWFLHSRTAFEVILMVSFYAWFLFFYLLYRYRNPLYLYPALIFGGMTFYAYANGQSVMAVTGVLLLISDFRYHVKHPKLLVPAAVLLVILALPYLRLREEHPEAMMSQLRTLDSYLFHDLTPQAKAFEFVRRYGRGLSPTFWFLPGQEELIRHNWKGLGNLLWITLPFWFIGLVLSFRYFKQSAYRALLIATLAAPFGASLADIGILRTLAFIVPASMFMTLGIDWLLGLWKAPRAYPIGSASVFIVGTLLSFWMLRDALVNGPTWYDNYGLYGMQWGAGQVFGMLPDYLRDHPNTRVILSPSWANGTDVFLRFFMPAEPRVQLTSVDGFITDKKPLDPNTVFVMTPDERQRAIDSKKFEPLQIDQVIPYPDGKDGFYLTHLKYVPNIDDIFAAEKEARKKPVTDVVTINGENVTVNHSVFDSGSTKDLVDGDAFTLARGREANPLLVEFVYPSARPITRFAGDFGSMDFELKVSLYADDNAQPVVTTKQFRGLPPDPHVEFALDNPPPQVKKVRIEVKDLNAGEPTHIHIREVNLK
ncbi:MAG: antitoxin AF2212-like protein [Anaerolineae bacterium]